MKSIKYDRCVHQSLIVNLNCLSNETSAQFHEVECDTSLKWSNRVPNTQFIEVGQSMASSGMLLLSCLIISLPPCLPDIQWYASNRLLGHPWLPGLRSFKKSKLYTWHK
ncbi:uncharacterized protein LOC120001582 [Tripterygium wilfordii]|uniref:uncharacterized protein LOC120001582 n=1 Tax=Tripterygium wilfordii TaxID=458696 RepID=UPI0018F81694|nr:uncharacterized protein LOC120001582 [Tripterygium wilfordii]